MAIKKHDTNDTPEPEASPEVTDLEDTSQANPPMALLKPMRLASALAVCASGWLLPGASHVVLGRWGRGLIFAASVVTMFVFGLIMQGRLYDITPEQPLHIFAFVADVGIGLPYIIAQQFGYGIGVLSNPNYDYGSTFLWVAGLLNYLIVLDAFDISQGRKP
jgi:hypothetical protein